MASSTSISSSAHQNSQVQDAATPASGPLRHISLDNQGNITRSSPQPPTQTNSTDLNLVEYDSETPGSRYGKLTFMHMRSARDEIYKKEMRIYNGILAFTPLQYKEQMNGFEESRQKYIDKVRYYVRRKKCKAEHDCDDLHFLLDKEYAVINARKDFLLTFSVTRFASSIDPGRPSRISPGKQIISREKMIWDLHFLYDDVLKLKSEYKRANQRLSEFLNKMPDYKKVYDSYAHSADHIKLIEKSRQIELDKTLRLISDSYDTPVTLSDIKERKKDLVSDIEKYERTEEQKTRINKSDNSSLKSAKRKALVELEKIVADIQKPPFYTKSATPHEAAALSEIKENLKKLNISIEKGKRTEGTTKYKAARARHNAILPQKYNLNPADHETLRAQKNEYNEEQKRKSNIQDGIKLRQQKDAALVKLTGIVNKVQDTFDDIKRLETVAKA